MDGDSGCGVQETCGQAAARSGQECQVVNFGILIIVVIIITCFYHHLLSTISITCFSGALKRYRVSTALNHLTGAVGEGGFERVFQRFLFDRVQREVVDGARQLREGAACALTREQVVKFDPEEHHASLLKHFPTITTAVTATVARRGDPREVDEILQVLALAGFMACCSFLIGCLSLFFASVHIFLCSTPPPLTSAAAGRRST